MLNDSQKADMDLFPYRLFVYTIKIPNAFAFGIFGALCGTRTHDLLVRSQTLYPTELRAHF